MSHALDRVKAYALVGEHNSHPWKSMPWRGVYNKVLFNDPVMGTTIELAKIEKGATFPIHYHSTVQTLFLVSGLIKQGGRLIKPGTFDIIPAGEKHAGYYGEEESIQFKYFSATPVYFMEDGTVYVYKTDGDIMKITDSSPGLDTNQQNFVYNGR